MSFIRPLISFQMLTRERALNSKNLNPSAWTLHNQVGLIHSHSGLRIVDLVQVFKVCFVILKRLFVFSSADHTKLRAGYECEKRVYLMCRYHKGRVSVFRRCYKRNVSPSRPLAPTLKNTFHVCTVMNHAEVKEDRA